MEPAPLTLFHTLPALPRAHQTIHRSFSGLGVKAVKGSSSGPFQMIHLFARLPQWERISNAETPRNQFCYLLTFVDAPNCCARSTTVSLCLHGERQSQQTASICEPDFTAFRVDPDVVTAQHQFRNFK